MVEKLVKDGKVAVLVSRRFGAGWSSHCYNADAKERMVFDPVIAQMILDGKAESEICAVADERYPNGYVGGIDGLCVEWVNEGAQFEIEEYDGSESVHVIGERPYYTA